MTVTRTSAEVRDDVAALLGVSAESAAQVLGVYYAAHPRQVPAGASWQDVATAFEQVPGVPYGGSAALAEYLRTQVTAEAADYPSEVLDDPQLRDAFTPVAASDTDPVSNDGATPAVDGEGPVESDDPATGPGTGTGTPVVEGGAVLRYGEEYFLGDTRLWLARDAQGGYFYDELQQVYDLSGQPVVPEAPVEPGSRIIARAGLFYLDGVTEVWRAADTQGEYFYDADNRVFDTRGEPIPTLTDGAVAEIGAGVEAETGTEAERPVLSADHPAIVRLAADIAAAIRSVEGYEILTESDLRRLLERELADFR